MTRAELLKELRTLEVRLRSAEVQEFFTTKTQPTKDRFVAMRNELSKQIALLANAELEDISEQLDDLSDEIEEGIESIADRLDELATTVSVLNGISTVLGLVGRVIAFIP
jgi:gas vesicle protein